MDRISSILRICLYVSLFLALTVGYPSPKIIPGFKKLAHGVSSGPVTILDSKRVLISKLRYDGAGPDAYFVVGKGGIPNAHGYKVQNELGSSNPLSGYDGVDVELTLPGKLTFNDIDYLSIYCVAFQEDFGHVLIPANLDLPEYAYEK